MLSQKQIQQYQTQGYLVLEKVFSPQQLTSLTQAAARVVNDFDIDKHKTVFTTRDNDRGRDAYFIASAENVSCFLEEDALNENGELMWPKSQAINKIGHALHDLIPEFKSFCSQPLFSEILNQLGYQAPELWQTMYIFKQPKIGGEVRWHQDATYLITEPQSVMGLWVAMEDSTKENGCLWVQPKGHLTPLREIFHTNEEGKSELIKLDSTPWPTEEEAEAVEVPAGSLVLFNGKLPHYSSHNHSARSRQAFTMHIIEGHTHWSSKNWIQRPSLGKFPI